MPVHLQDTPKSRGNAREGKEKPEKKSGEL